MFTDFFAEAHVLRTTVKVACSLVRFKVTTETSSRNWTLNGRK